MLLNRAKVATATAGAGTVTLGAAIVPFQSWAAAGAPDGATISYLIEDGNAWELGRGFYAAGPGTITRPGPGVDSTFASSTGARLALSGAATIASVANTADYQTIAGSGNRVLLQDVAVGVAVAQVALTAFNNAVYLDYEIEVSGVTSDNPTYMQLSTDGGATFDGSGLYDWAQTVWGSGGYNNTIHGQNDTGYQTPNINSGTAPLSASFRFRLAHPGLADKYKQITHDGSVSGADGNNYAQLGAGRYRSITPVNGARFYCQAGGNITGGRFRLYGTVA